MKNEILQEELEQSRLGSIEEERPEKKKEYNAFEAVFKTKAHLSGASTVQFSPDKKKLVTSGSDGLIKVWDMRRLLNCVTHDEPDRKQAYRQKAQPAYSQTYKELSIDKGPISCLAIDSKFDMIAVGGTQHSSVILIKRKPRLEIHKTLTNHTKPLTACKFFQDFDNK